MLRGSGRYRLRRQWVKPGPFLLQAQLSTQNEQLRNRLEGLRSALAAAPAARAAAPPPPQFLWPQQQAAVAPTQPPQQQQQQLQASNVQYAQHFPQLQPPPVPLFAASPQQGVQAPLLQTPPQPALPYRTVQPGQEGR